MAEDRLDGAGQSENNAYVLGQKSVVDSGAKAQIPGMREKAGLVWNRGLLRSLSSLGPWERSERKRNFSGNLMGSPRGVHLYFAFSPRVTVQSTWICLHFTDG